MVEMPGVVSTESPSLPPPVDRSPVDRSRRYPRILLILFLCTLPLVNPIVHGDGVRPRSAHRTQFSTSHTTINTRIPTLAISAWMGQANPNP